MDSSYSLYVFLSDCINSASNICIDPSDVIIAKTRKEAKNYFFYHHIDFIETYDESEENETPFADLSEEEKTKVIESCIGEPYGENKVFRIPLSRLAGMKELFKPYEDTIATLERQIQEQAFIESITDPETKEMPLPYEMVDHIMNFVNPKL